MQTAAIAFDRFKPLQDDACESRIVAAKAALGKRAVILGHHYQRADVYKHADLSGDSLGLSKLATQTDAEYIVFCGVHFMAEVADILSNPEQTAILPDMSAGCSMADMANLAKVERAWREIGSVLDPDQHVTPITYINSAADLKAFCGEHGGIVCTSSNATKVLQWAFERGKRVFFFPDQHLGRNTAHALGVPLEEMALYNWRLPAGRLGGVTPEALDRARVILWQGHCSVHQRFSLTQIEAARAKYPDVKIVVHPECRFDVVQAADANGSTAYIVKYVEQAPAGSVIGVGTEINLVSRLAHEHPDKTIFCLDPVVCPCSTMYRVHPAYLAWVMESLVRGEVVNRIEVPEETDRKSTRLNSSHVKRSRMPSSA